MPEVRLGLIGTAEKLYKMAESQPERIDHLDRAVHAFNEEQMWKH